MSSIKFCEKCGKEISVVFGSGRFCSRACANARVRTKESKALVAAKISASIQKHYDEGCKCEKCGNIFHSKDLARKLCFDCLPSVIRNVKVDKVPKTLLDVSSRTISKILRRMDLPCSCCGFFVKNVVLDIHHIKPKSEGGTNDMSNLTYICPNCHRIAHTDTRLLNKPLVSIEEQLKSCGKNWLDFYFGV